MDRHTLLIDETVEAYVDWREESAVVWDAYEQWEWASAADARLAFAAYCAAVEREERASNVYDRPGDEARRHASPNRQPRLTRRAGGLAGFAFSLTPLLVAGSDAPGCRGGAGAAATRWDADGGGGGLVGTDHAAPSAGRTSSIRPRGVACNAIV
jgi:hypothetical protein